MTEGWAPRRSSVFSPLRGASAALRRPTGRVLGSGARPGHCDACNVIWSNDTSMNGTRPRVEPRSARDALVYRDFPHELRSKLHGTNKLECLVGEADRRSDVTGIFPNEAAIVRLAGALPLEQNDDWATRRHHVSPEMLATLGENGELRLATTANCHLARTPTVPASWIHTASGPRPGTRPAYRGPGTAPKVEDLGPFPVPDTVGHHLICRKNDLLSTFPPNVSSPSTRFRDMSKYFAIIDICHFHPQRLSTNFPLCRRKQSWKPAPS